MASPIEPDYKVELWFKAQQKVKSDLEVMPDSHRERLSEVALSYFPELVAEIKECREKFTAAQELCDAGRYSERFVVLNRQLFRDVSLFLLGVAPNKKKTPP